MRFIKNQLLWWRIALVVGVAAISIPMASRNPTARAVVKDPQNYLDHQATAGHEAAYAKHSTASKAAVGRGVARPQDDDFYDRRREYWDRRVEGRLDRREEYLDEQTRDDKDDADTKDSKDNKAGKDDADDEEDAADQDVKRQEDEIERRREYWRKRLDRDW